MKMRKNFKKIRKKKMLFKLKYVKFSLSDKIMENKRWSLKNQIYYKKIRVNATIAKRRLVYLEYNVNAVSFFVTVIDCLKTINVNTIINKEL